MHSLSTNYGLTEKETKHLLHMLVYARWLEYTDFEFKSEPMVNQRLTNGEPAVNPLSKNTSRKRKVKAKDKGKSKSEKSKEPKGSTSPDKSSPLSSPSQFASRPTVEQLNDREQFKQRLISVLRISPLQHMADGAYTDSQALADVTTISNIVDPNWGHRPRIKQIIELAERLGGNARYHKPIKVFIKACQDEGLYQMKETQNAQEAAEVRA